MGSRNQARRLSADRPQRLPATEIRRGQLPFDTVWSSGLAKLWAFHHDHLITGTMQPNFGEWNPGEGGFILKGLFARAALLFLAKSVWSDHQRTLSKAAMRLHSLKKRLA
jgi:hypothetical protein